MWEIYNKNEYVDFETAKKLKKTGFKDKTIACYTKEGALLFGHYKNHNNSQKFVSAPTKCRAQQWLRDNNNIIVFVVPVPNTTPQLYGAIIYSKKLNLDEQLDTSPSFEERLEKGLKEALNIII